MKRVAGDREPAELTPLGEAINVDALQSLIDSSIIDRDGASEVTFEYEGYLVSIDDAGTISLRVASA